MVGNTTSEVGILCVNFYVMLENDWYSLCKDSVLVHTKCYELSWNIISVHRRTRTAVGVIAVA